MMLNWKVWEKFYGETGKVCMVRYSYSYSVGGFMGHYAWEIVAVK